MFVNVPIGAVVFFGVRTRITETERHTARLDVGGAAASTVGMSALVYGLTAAADQSWTSPAVVGSFVLAAIGLAALVLLERRHASPVVPLGFFHFGPAERERLWRKWAQALNPGGLLIMEAQYPQKAEPVPSSVVPGRTLGRRRYDTVSRADVIGDDMIRWVNTYRTWEGDLLVQEETAEFDCHVLSDERMATELSAAGLSPVPDAPESLRVWRR